MQAPQPRLPAHHDTNHLHAPSACASRLSNDSLDNDASVNDALIRKRFRRSWPRGRRNPRGPICTNRQCNAGIPPMTSPEGQVLHTNTRSLLIYRRGGIYGRGGRQTYQGRPVSRGRRDDGLLSERREKARAARGSEEATGRPRVRARRHRPLQRRRAVAADSRSTRPPPTHSKNIFYISGTVVACSHLRE